MQAGALAKVVEQPHSEYSGCGPTAPVAQALAALEVALDAVIVTDQGGRILHFSPAAEKLFDYRLGEALGQDMAALILGPAHRDRYVQAVRHGLETCPGPVLIWRLEVHACRSDGGEFPIELTLARLASQTPAAFVVYIRDQTQQQWVEASLRQSEDRYRDLIENANDIIYTHDLSGKLTSWNQAGERLLGYSAEDTRGMDIARIIVPEHLDRARQMIARKAAGGGRTVYEVDVLTKDGRKLTVEISSRLARPPGQPVEIHGMARDVTQRKQAEEALRETDRRKDEFLAILAHELRNPLAPIRNALHILKQPGAAGAVFEQAREMAERQVRHMARLLDDLLDVSQVALGKIELRKEVLDLTAVVRRSVEVVRPLFEQRGHQLTVALPPEPLRVEADPTRLEQIVTNLLNNAAKYTDPGGRIWLLVEQSNCEVRLWVRDTGIGIAAAMLPRVFDLFVQGERRMDRSQGGVGIGLTLVKRLVELHGGRVEASSTGPGQGSEFVVHLPAAPDIGAATGRGAGVDAAASAPAPPRRVLVVDDNVDAADSLVLLLRLDGHAVRVAYDGPTALLLARAFDPQVVLLDIGMPRMDGYEVARRLRQQPGGRSALVLALTGCGQEADRQRSVAAGFDGHLVKPVEPSVLQTLLAEPSVAAG
jgi:PAS domain S-box-containing protein